MTPSHSDELEHGLPDREPGGLLPQNITQKLLYSHLVSGELLPGADIRVAVDQILMEDATGTMTAMQFEMLGVDAIGVPLAVMYVDHNVLQIDDKNMQDHRYLQTFSARHGVKFSPPGHGIAHYIHLEHFAKPGDLLIGADSHTSMAGALGMFATGAGGLEVAVAMGGFGFDMVCPETVGIELTGHLKPQVEAKDIVLEILRRYDVRGGRGKVFEFYGSGVESLPTSARATICNMIIETGATTAVFPSDDETKRWLISQDRGDEYVAITADPEATFDSTERIDLSELCPLVAVPHSPGNVFPVSELPETEIAQVCVGSSVNSSYDDLATVAAALKGKKTYPGVQLTVTPGSRQILQTIIASGVYQDLMESGARMLEPICGPCVGIGQAPLSGAPSLRTFNRNFPGRSGTAEDHVYLCSPSTAAASALAGRIVDPSSLEELQLRPATPPDPSIHDSHITYPLPEDQRSGIVIERGPNLVPPPQPVPPPENLEARIAAVVGDDISTGDMAPDGAVAMAVWSNIASCARFMFSRLDPDFHDRTQGWGGGIIVAGENYGQGSSREHAALIPLHLGIRVIIAKSFARIHRRNLISVGIVPLLLPEDFEDFEIEVGQLWSIARLADSIPDESADVTAHVECLDGTSRAVVLSLDLSPVERTVLAEGGLLAQVRSGTRSKLGTQR